MLLHATFNQRYLFKTKNTFWIDIACQIFSFFIKKVNFVSESCNFWFHFWKYVALLLPKNSQSVVCVQNQTELQANCVTAYVDKEFHYQASRLLETPFQEVYYFNSMCNHKENQQTLLKIWLKYNFQILNRNVLQEQSKAIYCERFLKNHWNIQSAF